MMHSELQEHRSGRRRKHARGRADRGHAGGNIVSDDTARSDGCPLANRDTWDCNGANPDERAFAHRDAAGEMNAGREMHMYADDTVVVDGAGCVQDDVVMYLRADVDDDVGESNNPGAELHLAPKESGRVDGIGERDIHRPELSINPLAVAIIPNGDERGIGLHALDGLHRTLDRQALKGRAPQARIIIQDGDHLKIVPVPNQLERVPDDPAVSAGANQNKTHIPIPSPSLAAPIGAPSG